MNILILFRRNVHATNLRGENHPQGMRIPTPESATGKKIKWKNKCTFLSTPLNSICSCQTQNDKWWAPKSN